MHVRMSCHFILLSLCLSEECKYYCHGMHGWFFSLCIFAIMCLCISLCSSWGIWYQEKAKGLYSFKWRDVYLFCTAVFYIFVLSFFICVCHCLLNEKRLVTSCCQSVHKRTFCICICWICLCLCLTKVTASSLLFWNLPFPLQNGTIRQLHNVRNGGIYKEELSKHKMTWLANIFFNSLVVWRLMLSVRLKVLCLSASERASFGEDTHWWQWLDLLDM